MIGSKLAKKFDDFVGIDTKDGKDLLTCKLPKDIDVIYHLAAHASVEDSWKDPLRDCENIATTMRLVEEYPDAKIIYASTVASFNPESPYGFTKKCAHEYLELFHKNAVILVFPNIFGGPRSVVDIFKDRDEVDIYGDGKQMRTYVHVDDIVEGLIKAKDWDAGVYRLGGGVTTSVLELAGKRKINFKPARKEARESLLENTTPMVDKNNRAWYSTIDVMEYINEETKSQ